MKISNLEDLEEILKFYFSEDFRGVEGSEEEEIKKVIKKSIENIDGSVEKIKSIATTQLRRTDRYNPHSFIGNSKLILFITECLSNEDRKELIIKYLNETENYRGDKIVINGSSDAATYYIAVRGDTSGDGVVKINDLILVQSHILGTRLLTDVRLYAGDVNYDGAIKINDLILVQSHILGKGNL